MLLTIFDLDGTLVDSSLVLVNSINYVREKLHLKPLDARYIMNGITNPHINMADYFYSLESIDAIHEEWFKEYYSANHTMQLRLYNGVREMLESFSRQKITMAIATNGYRNSTYEALEYLDIRRYFSDIVCFEDVENGKPAPDMLHLLLEKWALSSEKALFIGDSDRDKFAAKSANIEFFQVDFGQNNRNVYNNPEEIKKIVEERKKFYVK